MFKYEWIWDKVRGVGFQVAKYRPMMQHESILVFGKGKILYNPIMTPRNKIKKSKCYKGSNSNPLKYNDGVERVYTERYPKSILIYSNAAQKGKLHPTQKPVALFQYLQLTYTNEGDTILDNCIGSGTTAVAAINTGRNFIGIEMDKGYCDIANKRIQEAREKLVSKLPL